MESPYVSKKVARKTLPKLQRFKALHMLEGRKITDMEAIDEAIDIALQKTRKEKRTRSFFELAGFIKGRRKSRAADEIDDVVYTGK